MPTSLPACLSLLPICLSLSAYLRNSLPSSPITSPSSYPVTTLFSCFLSSLSSNVLPPSPCFLFASIQTVISLASNLFHPFFPADFPLSLPPFCLPLFWLSLLFPSCLLSPFLPSHLSPLRTITQGLTLANIPSLLPHPLSFHNFVLTYLCHQLPTLRGRLLFFLSQPSTFLPPPFCFSTEHCFQIFLLYSVN